TLARNQGTRHLYCATTILKWDCIVCHREGYAFSSSAGSRSAYHWDSLGRVDLRNMDTVNEASGWSINNKVWTTTDYTNLDNFCMTCHDSDGAKAAFVTATNNGIGWGTIRSLRPFNSTDAPSGALGGSTAIPGAPRNRVVDVKTQFYAGTTIAGPNYNGNPSQHAVIGARYGTNNANWGTEAWGTVTLKKMNVQLRNVREKARLSCADCHVLDSGSGAHGGVNEYNLTLTTINEIDTLCNKCHLAVTYSTTVTVAGL
ncbi:MAG: hypothetical protein HY759_00485, partial [Nitrospirae bacterium]|nr:hypothetical protein [Nitrospirota bacterium]